MRGECIASLREVFSGEDTNFIRALELCHWSLDVNFEVVVGVRQVVRVEFAGRLEALCDDVGAMHMVTLAHLNGQIHLYVVHTVFEPDVIHMIEYKVDEGGDEVAPQVNEGGGGAQFVEGIDDGVRQQLDEGVGVDGERIKVFVGQAEMTKANEVEGERIEVEEDDAERTTTDEVQEERIEVEEADVEAERIEADEVEVEGERIEVDEADVEAERTKADEVEVECERIEVQEGDVERTTTDEVHEERI
ncbi:hypothetical protein LR48_Vigan01g138100 [Vigna angularis]|uniref:Uncharacterized protein n=1 Tax=Phaseolus angularis TaxID=3914 RepID=A0A0L9TMP2_PHAAN|nr:hypothetical protein LR48_Vigan01g138100 [Vigna angularis]